MTARSRILVARAIFPDALAKLEESFDVQSNQADEVFSPANLRKELAQVEGALVFGSERIDQNALADVKNLKIVANISVGYNNFDVPAMTSAGVMATNTPDVLTDTTADFGFALMMAAARRITESEHWIRNGQWDKMSIVYNHLIGATEIALMKPTATLVNIARGGIVDDAALAAALKAKQIFAAGLDVYEGEPKVHPELLKLSNVVLAPHIASATEKTRRAMIDLAVRNLRAALAGKKPPSLINTELWKK